MMIACYDREMRAVLTSGFYKVPRFQRPYSWDPENIEEFWQDSIIDNQGQYFIGSVLLYKEGGDVFGIVDGQQRLTTTTMILAAIRNRFQAVAANDLAAGLQKLIERSDINNQQLFVIQTETSYPFFQREVQAYAKTTKKQPIKLEEQALQVGFKKIEELLAERVKGLAGKKELGALKSIRDKVLDLKLIVIELDNHEDAYIAFETLNTRGKDLTLADLIRTHITRLLPSPNKALDDIKDRFNDINTRFSASESSLELNEFIYHHWNSKYRFSTEKLIYPEIKKTVRSKPQAKQFFDSLYEDSIHYLNIRDPKTCAWAKEEFPLMRSLEAIEIFQVKISLPAILSVIRAYKNGAIKLKVAKEVISAIETFHFMFNAITSQRSSGGISMMFAYHARQLHDAVSASAKSKTLGELVGKLKEKIPSKEIFAQRFGALKYSNNYTREKRIVQYILSRIDEHFSNTEVDYDRMTIEHIRPQNTAIKPRMPTEKIASIGNLMFLPPTLNQDLADKDFKTKKRVLEDGHVKLDDYLRKVKDWTVKEIDERSAYLAELAYDSIWRI